MLTRLLDPFRKSRSFGNPQENAIPLPGRTRTPDGVAIHAIGDIHGQIRQLRQALDWLEQRTRQDRGQGLDSVVVFLGDLIDRGEDSRGVIDLLSTLQDRPGLRWVCLAGNHEATLLSFLERPDEHGPWLQFGGIETLASYGVLPAAPGGKRSLRHCRDDLAQALPERHLAFLQELPPSFACGDYLFVHAGVRPGVPLDRQKSDDLLWIREEFLTQPTWHGKCIVHGHTIEEMPALHPWRIGIDTGAYAGGPLTCLTLCGQDRQITGFS